MAALIVKGIFVKVLIYTLPLANAITDTCHTHKDVGQYRCVPLPRYDLPQYATCLTDEYVKSKTDNRAHCVRSSTGEEIPICWYQCMIELHDLDRGYVTEDCRCDVDDENLYDKLIKPKEIPLTCHTPNGQNCAFYRECLEGKYNCHGNAWNEIITHGTSLCNFGTNIKKSGIYPISKNGTRSIQKVNQCIQVQLAPVLKQWLRLTCSNLETKSSSVWEYCLKQNFNCDIPPEDLWYTFWHMKKSLGRGNAQTLSAFMGLIQECSKGKGTENAKKLKMVLTSGGYKDADISIDTILNKIAESANWVQQNLAWYAELKTSIIYLWISLDHDTLRNSTNSLDTILTTFANEFKKGTFQYYIGGKLIRLISMSVCKDFDCEETYLNTNAVFSGMYKY